MIEWLLLALSVFLVLACGMFVAAEFAFVTVDRSTIERAAEAGDIRAQGTLRALRSLSTQLSGAQLGITLTNLMIGFLSEPAIAGLLRGPLSATGLSDGAVSAIAVGIGFVLANVVTMVLGELVPKNLAIANPVAVSGFTNRFQRMFTKAMHWPIRLFNGSANAIVRMLGVQPQEELRSARSPDEIASLARRSAQQGSLDQETAALVERSIAFGRRTADDIMTPRVRMHAVQLDDPALAIIEAARATGHSRFPVLDGSADDIVGAVHIKHAVAVPLADRHRVRIAELVQPATSVPESLELDPLLVLLRKEGMQMAMVVDEYGGTAGIVTLEDLVEEIVGEIADEHDRPSANARHQRDGSWLLSGLLRPDEVAAITGVRLPEDHDYETLAGLILDRLGRVPEAGERIRVDLDPRSPVDGGDGRPDRAAPAGVVLLVERRDGLRIDRVRLTVADDE